VNDPLRYEGINYFLVSTQTVASIIASTPAGDPLPLNKMGENGPITTTVGSGTEPVLLTFQFTSEENLPMDFVQVRRANTDTVTLQVVQYTDVARAPGEAPPLFVRAYRGQNFDQSYYNDFVPRSGQLVIPEFPDLRFSLKGDIAPILEVAKDADLTAIIVWFSLMAGGFAVSLYVTFQRCWVRISPREDGADTCDVMMGGLTDRNKVAFEREFERLATRARDALVAAVPTG
jgi:cytochrome c biogenesis protein ResB